MDNNTQKRYPNYLKDQREFFDELVTSDWDTYQNPRWNRSRQFEVDQLFQRVSPSRILDVGCGCGYHDLLMAEKSGVEAVVGFDYSQKSIEVANQNYPHEKVRRHVADIFESPAGDFDLVISFQVIEHLVDARAFLLACAKQVKAKGGWVAVVTPNRMRIMNRVLVAAGRPPLLADPQHYQEFTEPELQDLGLEVGMKLESSFGYGMEVIIPKLRWRVIPHALGLRLGSWIRSSADCICCIFRVERSSR